MGNLLPFINRRYHDLFPQTAVTANMVYRDKVIWQAQFGVMNNSEAIKRKPTADTIFPIASVTKVFTVSVNKPLIFDKLVT